MKSNALRAVAEEFIYRKYKSIALPVMIVGTLVLIFVVWLVTQSLWWLIIALPVTVLWVIVTIVLLLIRWIITRVKIKVTKEQKERVKAFVDKLERVADSVSTPVFLLIFRIAWDSIQPGQAKHKMLRSMVDDSSSLHSDFEVLQRYF